MADERTLINRVKDDRAARAGPRRRAALDGHAELVARGGADGAHLTGIDDFSAALESSSRTASPAPAASQPPRRDGRGGSRRRLRHVRRAADEAANLDAVERVVGAEVFELPCVAFARKRDEVAPLVAAGADFIALDYVWTRPARGRLLPTPRRPAPAGDAS